jgi:hypothetical protein
VSKTGLSDVVLITGGILICSMENGKTAWLTICSSLQKNNSGITKTIKNKTHFIE